MTQIGLSWYGSFIENEQFRHAELAKGIIDTFYEVYNELGHGFLESVYENSLALALRHRRLSAAK